MRAFSGSQGKANRRADAPGSEVINLLVFSSSRDRSMSVPSCSRSVAARFGKAPDLLNGDIAAGASLSVNRTNPRVMVSPSTSGPPRIDADGPWTIRAGPGHDLRLWSRPASIVTEREGKSVRLRHDGNELKTFDA